MKKHAVAKAFAIMTLLIPLQLIAPVYAADAISSMSKQIGDHLRLTTDVYGFTPVSTASGITAGARCAGADSTFSIVEISTTDTIVEFYDVAPAKSGDTCPGKPAMVSEGSLYKVANNQYAAIHVKTTGFAYGALVVPFKFRLGGESKLISSSTIAPYAGVRWVHFQGFGYEFMPVVSAGVALVPVANPATNKSETKSAFSFAVGATILTVKDSKFNAGFLIGKDFVSSEDRKSDPNVAKTWVSLWIGVGI